MKYFSLDHIAGMNCHYRYYTLEDFFASLQRRDITHAELWTCAAHYLLDEQGWQDAKALRRTARRYGIEVICLTPEQNNPKPHNLAARDPELIRRTYRYFSNAILAAEELECKLISVSSGWCFYSEPAAHGWQRAVQMLHELAEKARRHGVTLAIVYPGMMRVMRREKFDKLVQYAERVWGATGTPDEKVEAAITKTDEFFRSLGMKTRLSEHGVGQDTIDFIVERFRKRGWNLGESGQVTPERVAEILKDRL